MTTPPILSPLPFRSLPPSVRAGDFLSWMITLPWVPATGIATPAATSAIVADANSGLHYSLTIVEGELEIAGLGTSGVPIPMVLIDTVTGTHYEFTFVSGEPEPVAVSSSIAGNASFVLADVDTAGRFALSVTSGEFFTTELASVGTVTLSYVLTGVVNGVPTRIIINSGDITENALNLDQFTMVIPSSETRNWTPGYYEWICFMTDASGNRYPIAEGNVKILPDIAGSATPVDPRTQNAKTLYAINQLIAGRAVADVNMYEIAGRKLAKMTIKELMYFRGIVKGWVRAERKARGQRVRPNSVGVTFGGFC